MELSDIIESQDDDGDEELSDRDKTSKSSEPSQPEKTKKEPNQ